MPLLDLSDILREMEPTVEQDLDLVTDRPPPFTGVAVGRGACLPACLPAAVSLHELSPPCSRIRNLPCHRQTTKALEVGDETTRSRTFPSLFRPERNAKTVDSFRELGGGIIIGTGVQLYKPRG